MSMYVYTHASTYDADCSLIANTHKFLHPCAKQDARRGGFKGAGPRSAGNWGRRSASIHSID